MAFSANQVQGVFGEFQPVLDESVAFTADQTQGVFGEFQPVLDEAGGGAAAGGPWPHHMDNQSLSGGMSELGS